MADDIEIRDARGNHGRGTLYRNDMMHPNARNLTKTAWHLYCLVATYCGGNADGWFLDRAHLAKHIGVDPRHITEAAGVLRENGYLQTYRRTLPKLDGRKWVVGSEHLPHGEIDVSDGLEACAQWELRSPYVAYSDGPDDRITYIVDNLRTKPGEWRTLRTLRRWRVPTIGGGKGADGRIRQVGATVAELVKYGFGVNGARRVVPIDGIAPAEILTILPLAEIVAAGVGVMGDEIGRLVPGLHPSTAADQWALRGAGRFDPAPPPDEPAEGGSNDPAPLDQKIQHGVDEKIQPTSFSASSGSHRPLVDHPPPPALGQMHLAGSVPREKAEEWRQLCEAVVLRLSRDASPATWSTALADTRSAALLGRLHEILMREKGAIGKVRRIGPWSVSSALAEIRRAWLDGAWEIPARHDQTYRQPDGDDIGTFVELADAYDQASDEEEIEAAARRLGLFNLSARTMRERAELADSVRELRARVASILAEPVPERNAARAGRWLARATAAALAQSDRELVAVVDTAGASLDRIPWAWNDWLRSGMHAL